MAINSNPTKQFENLLDIGTESSDLAEHYKKMENYFSDFLPKSGKDLETINKHVGFDGYNPTFRGQTHANLSSLEARQGGVGGESGLAGWNPAKSGSSSAASAEYKISSHDRGMARGAKGGLKEASAAAETVGRDWGKAANEAFAKLGEQHSGVLTDLGVIEEELRKAGGTFADDTAVNAAKSKLKTLDKTMGNITINGTKVDFADFKGTEALEKVKDLKDATKKWYDKRVDILRDARADHAEKFRELGDQVRKGFDDVASFETKAGTSSQSAAGRAAESAAADISRAPTAAAEGSKLPWVLGGAVLGAFIANRMKGEDNDSRAPEVMGGVVGGVAGYGAKVWMGAKRAVNEFPELIAKSTPHLHV